MEIAHWFFFCAESFNADELKDIVYSAVTKLLEIGMNPKGVISDQGLYKLCNILEISTENSVFFANDHKMVYFYDTPHLMKSTRNSFLKYVFEYKDERASFKHVQHLVDFYSSKSYTPIPKITPVNLNPNSFEKMRVKYAVQLLSRTVAKSLKMLVTCNKIEKIAEENANMIEKFDNLFDCLNASSTSEFK